MDYFPDPPRWLGIFASIVLTPFIALFMLLWLVSELVHEAWNRLRG